MQQTDWKHRRIIVVPLLKLAEANIVAADWDPDVGGHLTFGTVLLSATGKEPFAYTLCNTALTDEMLAKVEIALGAATLKNAYDVKAGYTLAEVLTAEKLKLATAEVEVIEETRGACVAASETR